MKRNIQGEPTGNKVCPMPFQADSLPITRIQTREQAGARRGRGRGADPLFRLVTTVRQALGG